MPVVSHAALERHQVWWYLGAVALGAVVGLTWPASSQPLEALVWPTLGLLLYATFTQMNLSAVPRSLRDPRFLIAALVGNFVLMPAVVFGIVALLPSDEALVLGLLLVLLAPCTDWFITFTSLGGGDAERASALTPVALFAQLGLLPLYLLLFTNFDLGAVFEFRAVWPAILVLAAPLAAAVFTEVGSRKHYSLAEIRAGAKWFPVPLLTVVILCVAASHIGALSDNLGLVRWVALAGGLFLISALVMAKLVSLAARLPAHQGRTLAFALGTRNSFIVLPFALSLPPGWEIAAVVIVIQSLIELVGMIVYVRFVPAVLFPAH
ncbi:arsenic resistance protein [Nesterenkonia natronophila]|uniref:Arsenic resistance protein n=1 Tax=Nesterenkonia natronophila TaxID=2174932 RepID=A0A3A4F472_9MICC|nr:arsenic resistance protein [Nesterenkonia natronophila]RJN32616.1 arsenic resistance protein [Nesterenkonia natronophila]